MTRNHAGRWWTALLVSLSTCPSVAAARADPPAVPAPPPVAPQAPPARPAAEPLDATRLHVLLVGDTADPEIGGSVAVDLRTMEAAVEVGVPEARRTVTTLSGAEVTPDGILARVRALEVRPTDALLLYYAGHGAWAEAGPYLRMAGGRLLDRAALVTALRAKGPRLVVLLTDCCSTYVGKTALYAMPLPDPSVWRDLFFRHRGVVDVTAARRGQVAVGDELLGGVFTWAVAQALTTTPRAELDRDRDGIVTFAELLPVIVKGTEGTFKMMHPRGLSVRSQVLSGQTPHVFGALAAPSAPVAPSKGRLGVRFADAGGVGAQVVEVVPDSPAAWVGVRVGEVLTEVRVVGDDFETIARPITTVASVAAALAQARGPALVVLVLSDLQRPAPGGGPTVREVSVRLSH